MKVKFLEEKYILFEMAFEKISDKSFVTPNGVELSAYEDTEHKGQGPFVSIREIRYKLKNNNKLMPKIGEVWYMYFPIMENRDFGLIHPGIVVKSDLDEVTFLAIMVTEPPKNEDGSQKLRNSKGKLLKPEDSYEFGKDDIPMVFGPSKLFRIFHPGSLIRISNLAQIEASQLIRKMGELKPHEEDFKFVANIVKKAYKIDMEKLVKEKKNKDKKIS